MSITASSKGIMPQPKKAGKKTQPGAAPVEKPPVYEPNIPEPTTRAELMQYWIPTTMDDRTAQKLLWISEGGAKVSRMSEEVMCPYLDSPKRYEHSPQVLCKEGLLGTRGYWEVDYEGWVVIGVVYENAGRRVVDGSCGLGENDGSWGMGWAGSFYQAWHSGDHVEVKAPFCATMGIYVDQPAGIIKFVLVEGGGEGEEAKKEVRLLHQFKSPLKEKVFPGFWVGRKSFCWIRKKDQL